MAMTLLATLLPSVLSLGFQEAAEELLVPAPPQAMGANLTAGPSGIFLTWLEPGKQRATKSKETTLLRVSHLGPKGWEKPRTVVEGARLLSNWADFPSLIETSKKQLVAHWLRRTKGKGRPPLPQVEAVANRSCPDPSKMEEI